MSPLKALRADTMLTVVIIGGFVLEIALVVDGIATGQWEAIVGVAGVVGTLIGGALSALVVIAVNGSATKGPPP